MESPSKTVNDYGSFLKSRFPFKVQKISVNAGFTCPNRDGTKGLGGCTYCNNQTFSPDYCHTPTSVTQQVSDGVEFFSHKYPEMHYLAYFQAYTNTYGELQQLIALYEEALAVDKVVGLVIGTRPDCMTDELYNYLQQLQQRYFVMVEFGVESTHDDTLHYINRGHTYAQSVEAIERTAACDLPVGAHMILGLPGEDRERILAHAHKLSQLPLTAVKLHQLQLIRGTRMARQYDEDRERFHLYEVDEYIELAIDFAELLRPDIVIERFVSQSPKELLLAPHWGLKNHEFANRLHNRMKQRKTWQGRCYHP